MRRFKSYYPREGKHLADLVGYVHLVELCTGLSARRERENMTEREKALADKIMQAELFKMNKERTEYLKDKHGDKILEDDALKAMRILADCVLPSLISDKRDRFFDGYRKYLEYAMNICQYCDAHTHGGNEMARGLYWRMGKALAYGSFEWFILCMERNRDPLKKFYAPRKEVLKPIVEDLQKFENATKQKFYGLSLPSRVGKALAFDTPVLTNNGWKKHGDLTIKDKVVGFDGDFKDILQIHEPCRMEYRVTFSDGDEFVCHGNHEWYVFNKHKQKIENVATKDMITTLKCNDGHNAYFLPIKERMWGSHTSLWVAPYTLGAWLGDGRNQNPDICEPHDDYAIIQSVIDDGYPITWSSTHKITGVEYYGFASLRKDLQKYGMCHSRRRVPKHIPEEYFCADEEQRLELLAGLLDTDGTLSQKEHRYAFSTSEPELRDSFVKLISTFGWRVCVMEYPPTVSSSGIKANKPNWRISFNPNIYIPCRIKRKQLNEFSKQQMIGIEKIEKLRDDEVIYGNCISVDGGIYCVGERMKPTHNSTISLLFLAWVALRKPNSHSAMGGHSGMLAKGFWKELMNFFTSSEYCFEEMYRLHHPEYANQPMIIDKSAEDLTITFGDADRFATITCRGIDGTWTGAVDVSSDGYLYVDDLVRDREHSLNPVRMENTWQEYLNKMVDRKNDGAKELMVGTLWNIYDPLNRLANIYADNNAYKFRKIPALDYKTDESNFNYAINGFSTQYYREMRERLDEAEWMAKFQQNPQIREGILFVKADLHRFSEIPNSGQFYVWCDPALGGGDFTSMPIVIEADGKYKVVDWLYNNASPKVTVPKIVDKIIKWHIPHLGIEYNGGAGALVHKEIKDELTRRDALWCEIEPEYANTRLSKADKIKGRADFVKDNFEFLEDLLQEDEYKKAFNDMCIYTTIGKNVHDDSADSITSLALKIRPFSENGTVYIPDVNPFRQYGGRIY